MKSPGPASTFRALALTIVGVVFLWASFPPLEWAPFGWFAPAFWLAAVQGVGAEARFKRMFLAGYLVAASGLFWFWSLFGSFSLFLWVIFAFYYGVWGAVAGSGRAAWTRAEEGRIVGAAMTGRVVVWPAAAWCGVEYFRGELAPLCFSWLSLGYSQPNAVGGALAPWVGVYGISFVMVAWAGGVLEAARVWKRRGEEARMRETGARGMGMQAAEKRESEMRGTRMQEERAEGAARALPRASLPVLALSLVLLLPALSFLPIPPWRGEAAATVALQQFGPEVEPGAADLPESLLPPDDVDLVVWPEMSFFLDPESNAGRWVLDWVRPVAARTRWGMVLGAIDEVEGRSRDQAFYNTAFLIDPDGRIAGRAVKNRPVQLMNDGLPADDVAVFPPGLGVGVCYDGSYQRFARRMVRKDANILIFPTLNLSAWGAVQHGQHQRMFQMRAMETRRPVLTAAFSGPTMVAGPNGRAEASLPFGATGLLVAPVHRAPGGNPFFVLAGWWIGPLCLAVAALGVGWKAAGRIRRRIRSRLDKLFLPSYKT